MLYHHYSNDVAARQAIDDLRNASRSRRRNRIAERKTVEERFDAVADEIGELALFCHAAVELMLDKGLITHAELLEKMKQVDASDGTYDGKFTAPGGGG